MHFMVFGGLYKSLHLRCLIDILSVSPILSYFFLLFKYGLPSSDAMKTWKRDAFFTPVFEKHI